MVKIYINNLLLDFSKSVHYVYHKQENNDLFIVINMMKIFLKKININEMNLLSYIIFIDYVNKTNTKKFLQKNEENHLMIMDSFLKYLFEKYDNIEFIFSSDWLSKKIFKNILDNMNDSYEHSYLQFMFEIDMMQHSFNEKTFLRDFNNKLSKLNNKYIIYVSVNDKLYDNDEILAANNLISI